VLRKRRYCKNRLLRRPLQRIEKQAVKAMGKKIKQQAGSKTGGGLITFN
jgi:hypothetical protein